MPRLAEGAVSQEVHLAPDVASQLMRVAALRAAGLYRPTKRTEILWVEGGRELAIGVAALEVETADGLLAIRLPVRCDQLDGQSERPEVMVVFAVGTHDRPAGLYAATHRRPLGPAFVVDAWGDQLVAYAWQCILGLVSGLAGAVGKDERGNLLIPAELAANVDGLFVTPMGRHRFYGSSGLLPGARG